MKSRAFVAITSIFLLHPLLAVEKAVSESSLTVMCTGEWNNFNSTSPAGFTETFNIKEKTMTGDSVLDEVSESELSFHGSDDKGDTHKVKINRMSGKWEETYYLPSGDISFTGSGTCSKVDKAKF